MFIWSWEDVQNKNTGSKMNELQQSKVLVAEKKEPRDGGEKKSLEVLCPGSVGKTL